MCVIAWAWRAHPRYPFAVLANRDERHARPSAPLGWWTDAPDILAGRDLEAGGTWLGVTRSGRFAALTNRPGEKPPAAISRGALTTRFLAALTPADEAAGALAGEKDGYAGFNLLFGDGDRLALVSNRESDRALVPGVHGMANGALDEAIPKVARLVGMLSRWSGAAAGPDDDAWFELLADAEPALKGKPESAIFVRGSAYGTRSSSIVLFGADGLVRFSERRFDVSGWECGAIAFEFRRAP
ncbi:MAG: NRDE family protein [Gammaproteobacteria bacterium]